MVWTPRHRRTTAFRRVAECPGDSGGAREYGVQPVSAVVTPLGVRDGDPDAVATLIQRRGAAVLGYCEEVAAPGEAVAAASESFGGFRDAVASAPDVASFDAEGELVRSTRFAAANRAPQTGRGAPMVPTLLAARAEGELGPDDEERLTRLLGRSSEARTSADRMRRGEAAYTDPAAALPPRAAGPMVAALAAGAAIPATLHILGDGLGWGPEQVGDAIAAAGVTQAPQPEPRERELVAAFAPAAAGGAAAAAAGAAAAGAAPPQEPTAAPPAEDDDGRRRKGGLIVGGLIGAAALAAAVLALAGVFSSDEPNTVANDPPA